MIKFYFSSGRYTALDTVNLTQGFSAKSEILAIIELVKYPLPLPPSSILTDTTYQSWHNASTIRHLQSSSIPSIPKDADLAYFLEHHPEYFI